MFSTVMVTRSGFNRGSSAGTGLTTAMRPILCSDAACVGVAVGSDVGVFVLIGGSVGGSPGVLVAAGSGVGVSVGVGVAVGAAPATIVTASQPGMSQWFSVPLQYCSPP